MAPSQDVPLCSQPDSPQGGKIQKNPQTSAAKLGERCSARQESAQRMARTLCQICSKPQKYSGGLILMLLRKRSVHNSYSFSLLSNAWECKGQQQSSASKMNLSDVNKRGCVKRWLHYDGFFWGAWPCQRNIRTARPQGPRSETANGSPHAPMPAWGAVFSGSIHP